VRFVNEMDIRYDSVYGNDMGIDKAKRYKGGSKRKGLF